ncbi:hypothetical protein [Aquimarina algiphila]|uniref:KTSC domain-containing protein n=1 Tax=Aquimarina algiphila TaxID=2047982 RepID=A0A554VRQ3_9FLAO|nr:hypothetical protein [Aquimarina algiphila]TSE11311.1 hypothetical protein FOF46_01390 [Aquimarina algiphila]
MTIITDRITNVEYKDNTLSLHWSKSGIHSFTEIEPNTWISKKSKKLCSKKMNDFLNNLKK